MCARGRVVNVESSAGMAQHDACNSLKTDTVITGFPGSDSGRRSGRDRRQRAANDWHFTAIICERWVEAY